MLERVERQGARGGIDWNTCEAGCCGALREKRQRENHSQYEFRAELKMLGDVRSNQVHGTLFAREEAQRRPDEVELAPCRARARTSAPIVRPRPIFFSSRPSDSGRYGSCVVGNVGGGEGRESEVVWVAYVSYRSCGESEPRSTIVPSISVRQTGCENTMGQTAEARRREEGYPTR